MKIESLENILSEHPFFHGLDPKYLQLVTGCAANVRFGAEDAICNEGEEANQFYLIRQGRVALEIQTPNRGALTIQTIGEGEVFGWSWLFPPYRWNFSARAVEPILAIGLNGKCLREKCEKDHSLGYDLMKRASKIMIERLNATRIQLLDIYGVGV